MAICVMNANVSRSLGQHPATWRRFSPFLFSSNLALIFRRLHSPNSTRWQFCDTFTNFYISNYYSIYEKTRQRQIIMKLYSNPVRFQVNESWINISERGQCRLNESNGETAGKIGAEWEIGAAGAPRATYRPNGKLRSRNCFLCPPPDGS